MNLARMSQPVEAPSDLAGPDVGGGRSAPGPARRAGGGAVARRPDLRRPGSRVVVALVGVLVLAVALGPAPALRADPAALAAAQSSPSSPTINTSVIARIPADVSALAPVVDTGTGEVYVPSGGNTTTAISPTSNAVVGTFLVDATPHSFVGASTFDAANGDFYAAATTSSPGATPDELIVFSGSSDREVANITLPANAGVPAVDPVNGDVYVPILPSNVTVVSGATNTVVGSVAVPSGALWATVDSANGDVYVGNGIGSNVSVLNGSTNAVVTTIPLPYPTGGVATYDPADADVYVPAGGFPHPYVMVVSTRSNIVVATVTLSGSGTLFGPVSIGSNGSLYVTYGESLDILSSATNTLVGSTPIGPELLSSPAYDAGDAGIYLSDGALAGVTVVSADSFAIVANLSYGPPSSTLTGPTVVDPQNGEVYSSVYTPGSPSGSVDVIGHGAAPPSSPTNPGALVLLVVGGIVVAIVAAVLVLRRRPPVAHRDPGPGQ